MLRNSSASVLEDRQPISDLGGWSPAALPSDRLSCSDEARIGRSEPLNSSQRRQAVFRTCTRYRNLKTSTTTSATNAAIII
jgi:hypothetical protein